MKTTTAVGARADGPINGPLRVTFGAAWLVDLVATVGVFLAGVTAAYAICAANNVVLLVSGTPVVETLVF